MKLSKGWWLIRTDVSHSIAAGPFLADKNEIEEGYRLAEGYAKANYKRHEVAFLYVEEDNFAWGE